LDTERRVADRPIRIYWWLIAFPHGVLVATLLALNFLGDDLRDAWDVKGK